MANNHIVGKVLILLELPDGGIARNTGMPNDPGHNKGNSEIINEIIQQGIVGTNWTFNGMGEENFTLIYGGA